LEDTFLLVSNLQDGVDLYKFPTLEKVRTFIHPIVDNVPLQVDCTSDGKFVVCGGDGGFVRVFCRSTGEVVQHLSHGGTS
ncbi:hypothetical protein SCHPADRAFT_840204, partial [Schizopora paradoxa]